jgi:uncharacterized protein
MYLADSELVLSPSDLNSYVSCPHLTALDLAELAGDLEDERVRGAEADLLSRKGDEHELAYLQRLKDEGRRVVEIPRANDGSLDSMREAAGQTTDAMRQGAEVIFQGTFFDQVPVDDAAYNFRGHTDFLFRVDGRPSDYGNWSYEVADTKLARRAKPYFILQLCFYSELLEHAQGIAPERIHVVLGDPGKTMESFRLVEFSSYFRRIRSRFLRALAERPTTYPEPCDHCAVCGWRERCEAKRIADDHLSLVAGIRTSHREKLVAAGVETLESLARLPDGQEIDGIRDPMLAKLHEQAALQLEARLQPDELPPLRRLEIEPDRGFARLPTPSIGDVFFDMEGDPFFEEGLEYLFGYVTREGADSELEFTAIWGRDRAEEKQATERFIDAMLERLERWPDLHIYHYNHYEVTALKRLTSSHGTREDELDDLLRGEVFVDLLKVVREGLRIGTDGYGLKRVEAFFMPARETDVADGGDSVVEFERWLDGDERGDAILEAIADYNEDDCVSTLRLRDWLLGQRELAVAEQGVELPWFERHAPQPDDDPDREPSENELLRERMLAGIPADPADRDETQRAFWLLAQLLTYHRREERSMWWQFFDRADQEPAELIEDADCLGDLSLIPGHDAERVNRSEQRLLSFPTQETKVGPGSYVDPASVAEKLPGVTVVEMDDEAGTVLLKRGPSHAGRPWPTALIPGSPYRTDQQRAALARLGRAVLEQGLEGPGPYRAARELLLRRRQRVDGIAEGDPLHGDPATLDDLRRVVHGLDASHLMVQGPPGTGKTYSGARMIVDLIDHGKRVGVTSTSHRAIHNLLAEVEEFAVESGVSFRGLKKCTNGNDETVYESEAGLIESVDDNTALTDHDVKLAAGTAWHFCRDEVDGTLNYLFVDEAGQISLADALALSTSAENLVLLGDPQQLPQVSQGRHPPGSDASVLEHLLGDLQTIPSDRGVFLGETYRMCPEICEFVSDLMYDGRLVSAPGRELQALIGDGALAGSGTRWLPVEHEDRAQRSPEEATAIAGAMAELLANGRSIDCDGSAHPLTLDDILVVTPFNAQVKCLHDKLPADARIGTVDKFQGQTAQVVFFSMASSSGEIIPRGLEFLFSRNRLNVAMSRARCLSVLVCSPRLPDITCKSVDLMRLVNAVCVLAVQPACQT